MRRMISSTRISGLFMSSMRSSAVPVWRGVYPEPALSFATIARSQRGILAPQEIEQGTGARLEWGGTEPAASRPRRELDAAAQGLVFREPLRPGAQLLEGCKPEPAGPVLHDFALATAVEHDRGAAVLHRFDGRHPEVLDELRVALAEAAGVPEDGGAAVPLAQLVK